MATTVTLVVKWHNERTEEFKVSVKMLIIVRTLKSYTEGILIYFTNEKKKTQKLGVIKYTFLDSKYVQ